MRGQASGHLAAVNSLYFADLVCLTIHRVACFNDFLRFLRPFGTILVADSLLMFAMKRAPNTISGFSQMLFLRGIFKISAHFFDLKVVVAAFSVACYCSSTYRYTFQLSHSGSVRFDYLRSSGNFGWGVLARKNRKTLENVLAKELCEDPHIEFCPNGQVHSVQMHLSSSSASRYCIHTFSGFV